MDELILITSRFEFALLKKHLLTLKFKIMKVKDVMNDVSLKHCTPETKLHNVAKIKNYERN